MAVAAWRRLEKWEKRRVTIILTVLTLAAAFGAGLLLTLAVKSTEVYERALTAARRSPELREAIGSPIEDGLYAGNYSYRDSTSEGQTVEATLYVSGPKGSATVYAYGDYYDGEWDYSNPLAVVDGSGRRIQLQDPGSSASPAPGDALAWRGAPRFTGESGRP